MKALIKAFFRALTGPAIAESGEFLSTRRKAHLLYAEMYTRVASEAQASRGGSIATAAHPLNNHSPSRSVGEMNLTSAQAGLNS